MNSSSKFFLALIPFAWACSGGETGAPSDDIETATLPKPPEVVFAVEASVIGSQSTWGATAEGVAYDVCVVFGVQ